MRRTFPILLLALALTACAARADAASDPTHGLRAAAEVYARSTSALNADSVVAFFDPEIVAMSPQGRSGPVRGLEPNRAAWQRFFAARNPAHTMTTDTVVVAKSGDMGYTLGHWTAGMDTPDGRFEAAGQCLAVWRRTGRDWKITAITAYTFH